MNECKIKYIVFKRDTTCKDNSREYTYSKGEVLKVVNLHKISRCYKVLNKHGEEHLCNYSVRPIEEFISIRDAMIFSNNLLGTVVERDMYPIY